MSMLTEPLCITLQCAISELGPVPDKYGNMIKSLLYSEDLPAQIGLGATMDQCIKDKSWLSLDKMQTYFDNRKETK